MDMLRGTIITSKCADRMLRRVSPIYDNSYVGLWMFEAIGREYDKLWEIVESLDNQMFPETATWAIQLWERRYGIPINTTKTIEERRRALLAARGIPRAFTPYSLENLISGLTSAKVICEDYISPYTFGICIESTDSQICVDYDSVKSTVNRHKPSHLSYEVYFQATESAILRAETSYWYCAYSFSGTSLSGQLPFVSTQHGLAYGNVIAKTELKAYIIPYKLSGTIPAYDS